jgi:hypothetical protein
MNDIIPKLQAFYKQTQDVRQFFGGSHELLKAGLATRRIWRFG